MDYALLHPLCFLVLLLLLAFPISAQTYQNKSLGSFLSASNESPSWTSPSGDYAFGFQPIGTKGFLLSIWFDKIPKKTIVWSANRDSLVERGAKVELTTDGQLKLSDHREQEIWSTKTHNNGVAYAFMLDTGNFVLRRQDSVNIWESFKVPTDTILPTQILDLGSKLVSRQTETNYSSGRFQLRLQSDGNLVFYTMAFPTEITYVAYWASMTQQSGLQLVFSQSGNIYLTQRIGSLFNVTNTENAVSTSNFFQRAVLDHDGVLAQYVYPKTPSGGWPASWSTVWLMPKNICMISGTRGSGACGFNSYCTFDPAQRPICQCPPGYTYLDPDNKWNGCKQNFAPQSCNDISQGALLFDMRGMINTDWPMHDYERYELVNESSCGEACLSDCFCAITFYRDGMCWKKGLPLANGRVDPTLRGKALIKVRKGDFSDAGEKKESCTIGKRK